MREAETYMKSFQTLLNIFLVLALVGVVVFWRVDRNEYMTAREIEVKREKERLQHKEDSLRVAIKSLQSAELEAIKLVQEATIRADRAEAAANKFRKEYEKIRFTSTSTDLQRDSLLAAILSN